MFTWVILEGGIIMGISWDSFPVFAQLVVGSNGPPVQRSDTVSVRARPIKPNGERWPDKADWVVEMDWVRAIDNVCELHDMSHLQL